MDLSREKWATPLFNKTKGSSQRLPWFLMSKETGKGYLSGNLCGIKLKVHRRKIYDVFDDSIVFMIFFLFDFLWDGSRRLKLKRKRSDKIKAQDENWRKRSWKSCLLDTTWPKQHRQLMGTWRLSSEDWLAKCSVFLLIWLMSDDENFHPARGKIVNLPPWKNNWHLVSSEIMQLCF